MYKKIMILGGSGSGKSTLASKISLHTGHPVYHLDALFLHSNLEKKEKEKLEEVCRQFLSKDVGVVEGNYANVLFLERAIWADRIIFIDVSTRVQLYRVLRRMIRIIFGFEKRHGLPEGGRERFSIPFLLWIYRWNKENKKKIFSLLNSVRDEKVTIINNPKKVDINELLNDKK